MSIFEKIIEKTMFLIMCCLIFIGALILNVYISNKYEKTILIFGNKIFYILFSLLIITPILLRVFRLCRMAFMKTIEFMWDDIKKKATLIINPYINRNEETLNTSDILQLMEIYNNEEQVFNNLITITENKFKNDSTNFVDSSLAFYLLENKSKNEITLLFEKNDRLKKECEQTSKNNLNSLTSYYRDIQNNLNVTITENDLRILLKMFLHICLPDNGISRTETVEILLFITKWFSCNITKNTLNNYNHSLTIYALMIPILKRKLKAANIHEKEIDKKIKEFENSKWLKALTQQSFDFISYHLKNNGKYFRNDEKWIIHVCMISLYFSKIKTVDKIKLLKSYNSQRLYLDKEYNSNNVISILLICSPLRGFKGKGDIIGECISLIYYMTQLAV